MEAAASTAYSYLRYSTPRQEWGDSERRQEYLATEYCQRHGLNLSEKSFADRGISGWKGANRRGALGELLKLLKSGDVLLIEDNDRLSREDPLSALNLLNSIVFKGVTIIVVKDNLRITKNNFFDLSVFLPMTVKAALANEESNKKSERIKHSWVARRAKIVKGEFTGGKIPFWIRNNNGKLTLIKERAAVIRKIFAMSSDGLGARSILRKLAADGVPTFRQNKEWSRNGLLYLLNNIAVYGSLQPYKMVDGKRTPVGEVIDNYYPAVISKNQFLAVQRKIEQRIQYGGGGNKGPAVSNLFTSVMKCSHCGNSILLTSKGKGSISYMVCANYHWHHKCKSSIANATQVEKSILDYIMRDGTAIQYFSANNEITSLQKELDEKLAVADNLKKTIEKLGNKAIAEDLPKALLDKMKSMELEHSALQAECNKLQGTIYNANNTVSLESIAAYIQGQLTAIGKAKFKITKEGEYQLPPKMTEDRHLIREAFRTYIKSMTMDLGAKRVVIEWQSNAKSIIEMTFKRRGQKKAEYFYRSKTNGGYMSDWFSIGSAVPNGAVATTPLKKFGPLAKTYPKL